MHLQEFVLEYGYLIVQVQLNDMDCRFAGYTIATVITQNPALNEKGDPVLHAVVYLNGELVHDPNFQKKPIDQETEAFDVFIPIIRKGKP